MMPKTVQEYCHDSLDLLIEEGLLAAYERSGRFRTPKVRNPILPMDQWELLHYGTCAGALYEDPRQWEIASRLVNTFTRRGQRETSVAVVLENVYGAFGGVRAEDLLESLPIAFSMLGFHCRQSSPVTRDAVYVIGGSAKVSKLPEPFGKWWQIRESTPRWNEDVMLELTAAVRVSESATQDATMRLTLSTLALPVVTMLGSQLMAQLQRQVQIPGTRDMLTAISRQSGTSRRWACLLGSNGSAAGGATNRPAGRYRSY